MISVWKENPFNKSGLRREAVLRIFRVYPAFDGPSVKPDLFLFQPEFLAQGDPDLPFDQVYPGYHFCDRVFNLDAGVHLHEIVGSVFVEDKLDGAGRVVSNGLGKLHGQLAHLFPCLGIDAGRGCFFDQFLVFSLQGAFPFTQMNDVPVSVSKDLKLQVFGVRQVFLDKNIAVTEGSHRFIVGRFEVALHGFGFFHDAHSASATTR